MKMYRLYEWPEIDRASAKRNLQYYADKLAAHERGELDEPLTDAELASTRMHWAELNYLAYGNASNPERVPSVNDIDWDEEAYDDGESASGHIPPHAEHQPLDADEDVIRNGECVIWEGEDLWDVQRELETDLELVNDGSCEEAIEIKTRLSKVREAITEQIRYREAEVKPVLW